ncbi:peptidoglycan editing factor PgeF [bacterium]|nr:peptidoglycan editing factor PgeF [bacterium]
MRLPNWYRVEENGLWYYRAWNLHTSRLVSHGFSTRIGGVSHEPYNTLNLGLTVDDDPEAVLANRRAFAGVLGLNPEKIVVPNQIHSNIVKVVTETDAGAGALDHSSAIADADALITNVPDLPLALHFADCVCIFLLDPENRAIGVVHAGWRGTAANIVTEAVKAMEYEYGTQAGDIQAAISPSIGRNCFVVGKDVAEEIFKAFPHDDRILSQSSTDKWFVDLKNANFILLRRSGVPAANIAISQECTSCNSEDFYSYRRDGKTGRMGGWMSLLG